MQRSPSDREKQDPYQQKPEDDHGLIYFIPGQVVLLVEHEQGHDAEWIIDQTRRMIGDVCKEDDRSKPELLDRLLGALKRLDREACEQPGTVLTFQRQTPRLPNREPHAFSQIFVDLDLDARDDKWRTSNQQLIKLLDYLNRKIMADRRSHKPLALSVASPNWLAGCAQPGITGGPGAPPVPAPDIPASGFSISASTATPPTPTPMWEFTLPPKLTQTGRQKAQGYQDVEVAILDTAPTLAAFDQAHRDKLDQTHPLLKAMLQSNGRPLIAATNARHGAGKLKISYANKLGIDLRLPDGYTIKGHKYEMSDHGLFVAGIINSIAPQAKLHLIEILDSHGVGTLHGLAQALSLLIERNDIQRLVVNCSLTIAMPLPGHSHKDLNWRSLETDCGLLTRMGWLTQWISDTLFEKFGNNVHVVAAAGNDAHNHDRPQARFPAALDRVIGVGALGPNGKPASYSNLADTPMRIGIATFGGSIEQGHANDKTGMLGTYIGAFPPAPPTTSGSTTSHTPAKPNGWARWAGTSFAAPVISGTLAMLVGQGIVQDFAQAEQRVRNVQPDRTDEGEEIFMVQQGVAGTATREVPV